MPATFSSIGARLAMRQIFFMLVVGTIGWSALMATMELRDLAHALSGADPASSANLMRDMLREADRTVTILFYGLIAGCVIILFVSLPLMHYSIAVPIQRVAKLMGELAGGNTEIAVPAVHSNDEVGVLSAALGVLRDAMRRNNAMVAEIKTRDDREARLIREAAIRARVEEFSLELSTTTQRLGDMTKHMARASETMIVAARRATEGSSLATGAAGQTAVDVSSVATASEELLESIGEISRQVVQSTSVVKKAVSETQDSSNGMARLSAAARRVGDVVSLISRIAAQTNLLALNATIEAARAGDAGRGFAVVAQEVKTLATQTTKATQDIADQIADMQTATELSVAAIDAIQRKIGEVEQITSIIAAAVHEQGASTQEIARNVRSAASAASAMSSHTENVSGAVSATGTSVESVVGLAHELDEMVSRMRASVGDFAKQLKAA